MLPVFPPDEVPDLSVLDGLPAKVHVETNAGGQVIAADATVALSAPIEVVSKGCVL